MRFVLAVTYLAFVANVTLGQETRVFSYNGSDGYRPTPAQAADVDCIGVFCAIKGVDDGNWLLGDGPVQKELAAHVKREARRLFPGLKYSGLSGGEEFPKEKYLYLNIRICGSGLKKETCATHLEAYLSISDPKKNEYEKGSSTTVVTAESRQHIVAETKRAVTTVLEMMSDGWHEPHGTEPVNFVTSSCR